jgi:hypothetical protein
MAVEQNNGRWFPRLRFSLSDILVALVALSVGFSIWRLPEGEWIDIPLAATSFYFAIGLVHRAIFTQRRLVELPDISTRRHRDAKLFIAALLGLALVLVIAWFCRYFSANKMLFKQPDGDNYMMLSMYVIVPRLPADLAILAMLAAAVLGSGASAKPKTPFRQKTYSLLAIVLIFLGVILYWADRMVIPLLVYLAV